MRRPAAVTLLLAALACLLASVVAAQRVEIVVDPAATTAITRESSDEELLAAVASVITGKLGLPLVTPLYAHFYDSEQAFEAGLVRDAGSNAATVGDLVRFAAGVGSAKGIFLRRDRLKDSAVIRGGLFAHELTHVAQAALAGGRRVPAEQWLREGHADWVKYQVVEHLGLQRYARARQLLVRDLRAAGPLADLPRLTTLSAQRDWVATRNARSRAATYVQAFFAAEYLIELRGAEAVATYFRRASPARDAAAAFAAAFGLSVEEFAADFARELPKRAL